MKANTVTEFKSKVKDNTSPEVQKLIKYIDEHIEHQRKMNEEFGLHYDLDEIPSSVAWMIKKLK